MNGKICSPRHYHFATAPLSKAEKSIDDPAYPQAKTLFGIAI
jgi:hypothetical protein